MLVFITLERFLNFHFINDVNHAILLILDWIGFYLLLLCVFIVSVLLFFEFVIW